MSDGIRSGIASYSNTINRDLKNPEQKKSPFKYEKAFSFVSKKFAY